ncbi:hypothetical protein OC842_002544 [Tilletia horrida]|uniref:3'-phosphate/5'-hydroxy nucleic acid ligase n=1 Tax=Tilletia horrida TaxID=155126 RepID=A0AAN6GF56_9BASI|nr:hypothetical protein OC842_002544 [Tilletia horrida]
MPSVRATLVSNLHQNQQTVAVFPSSTVRKEDIFKLAKNKLGIKRAGRIFTADGAELTGSSGSDAFIDVANGMTLLVSTEVGFIGAIKEAESGPPASTARPSARVLSLAVSTDQDSIDQLHLSARLPSMRLVAAMPDLHAGSRRHPVGAAFVSAGRIFPALVGGDIGCGMLLLRTRLDAGANVDRMAVKMRGIGVPEGLEGEWTHGCEAWKRHCGFEDFTLSPSAEEAGSSAIDTQRFDRSLGTIGAGNHFAELTVIEEVVDETLFAQLGLDYNRLLLLVHSGSRGLGAAVLDATEPELDTHGSLNADSEQARTYLRRQEDAIRWAKANRMLIAHRVLAVMGERAYDDSPETLLPERQILDICHNRVDRVSEDEAAVLGLGGEGEGSSLWIHRKGAAPSTEGLVVIPGSRGTLSYVVQPIGDGRASALSLAHGAGRSLSRHKAHALMSRKYNEESRIATLLERTPLGGRVICEDRALLYEEAPEAYKDAGAVVRALEEAGAVKVVMKLRPMVTYKCTR